MNCDARTKLEAQAYVAWMNGSLQFELQLWKQAMENLKKAQVVYGNLASALPEAEQIMYKARVEELAPSLRYCAYNIGDTSAIDDLMQMRGQLSGELMASLDSLIAQTREKQANMEEVTWRGKSCGTVPPRAAGLIIADSRLNQALEKAATNQAKIDLLEAHLIDCKDALSVVRDHFKTELKNRESNDKWSAPQHLINYLQYIRLSRTLERNLALVSAAEESEKAKPQDIVRLYEAALHNLVEISQLQDDAEFLEEQTAKTKGYRAFRCYYIAQSLANLHRWREAMALYQRSLQHVKDALKYAQILPDTLKAALCKLETSVEAAQYAAHAHSVLEDHEEDGGTNKHAKSKKPLYERLHEYREDPALLTKQPNVYKLPPPMRSIPCKPLFFDLAFNMVEFPDLSHKLGDQAKRGQAGFVSGFVKGLWGWGNK